MLGALIGAGASLLGGVIGSNGAKKAAKKQAAAAAAALAEQRRQFDTIQQQQQPWIQTGSAALSKLGALYGIPAYQQQPAPVVSAPAAAAQYTSGGSIAEKLAARFGVQQPSSGTQSDGQPAAPSAPMGAPDYSDFYNSPDYKFALSEGLGAVQNSAAARGGLYSGNAMRALQERGAGIASQQYGNYYNRLAALAGIGQTATNNLGQFGMQSASNVGNLLTAQGDARASGVAGSANAWGNALGSVAGIGYDYFRNRVKVPTTGNSWGGTVGDS